MAPEAELTKALSLIDELLDGETCRYDHNGDCQTHGYFGLDQASGELCPQEEAQQFLIAHGLKS